MLQQFEEQDAAGGQNEEYLLVTTGRASKKVTNELRAAWEAFRSSPESDFFRDQPKALKEIIEVIRATLSELRMEAKREKDPADVDRIIRKSRVIVLDVEAGDPHEQAIIVVLQARNYTAPSGVWGKTITDCITYAKGRRTITIGEIAEGLEKFRIPAVELPEKAANDILQVELGAMDFPCEREVILARSLDNKVVPKGHLIIMILSRFDGDCDAAYDLSEKPFKPIVGTKFDVLFRAATVEGLFRVMSERLDFTSAEGLGILNLDERNNHDNKLCVSAHRQRLDNALSKNDRPLLCLHCGQAVWEPVAQVVELGDLRDPRVGLVHSICLGPTDRVIGGANMPMAEKHPELVNFDVNAWFQASNGGQRTFANLDAIRTGPIVYMGWGGFAAHGPVGQFLVEVGLVDGGSEILTLRNKLHRFTKADAERIDFDPAKRAIRLRRCYPVITRYDK
ncbi:hypothetical protein [Brucella rhizosphaerae]|uniref:Uncharacterized protein n=1 Tax=Brucella rhizosphaerae TaxID=571254 RepID=A0A256FRR5_9HYPH|nr:hypothetical protein [Brucella rhizosphaerae]OYR17523.1 hypothetical protein CEV32_3857 [Brucella rhizosphaerae]